MYYSVLNRCPKFRNIKLKFFILLIIFYSEWICGQNIGINGTGASPNSKALLDVDASSMISKGGVLIPRLTTAERNAITGTIPESLLIYNTSTQCFEAWNSNLSQWVSFGCIGCQVPINFSASSASSVSNYSFTANWGISSNATGYYLDVSTSSTFSSFVTGFNNLYVGNVLTYTISGLICSKTYYYRVRAVNSCGIGSNSNTISATTGNTLAITHTTGTVAPESKNVTYNLVSSTLSGADKCWIAQNLGASNQASSSSDATDAAGGWYWQFNRKQGYKVNTLSPAWTITSINENSDWISANDPCTIELGTGWRIPTYAEWLSADVTASWNTLTDVYNSVLKLHAAGYLHYTAGTLTNRSSSLDMWSSTQYDGMNGWFLNFNSGANAIYSAGYKSYGYTMRCIKD